MAVCRRCGNQMADTAAACPACGELRYQPPQPAAPQYPAQPQAPQQYPQPQYAQPQQAYSAPQAAAYAIPVSQDEARGFFAALFDLSFTTFITTKFIKFAYILFILIAGLGALALIAKGFDIGTGAGLGALVLSPIVFFIYLIGFRILLESVINAFRITEHLSEIAKNTKR